MYFRIHLSEIDSQIPGSVEFTAEWFKEKLEEYFSSCELYYEVLEENSFQFLKKPRRKRKQEYTPFYPLPDVNIVFLAGGTCRIPFVQNWVKRNFPGAKIIEEQLQILAGIGAAVHALQVLSGEVEPYVKAIKQEGNESSTSEEVPAKKNRKTSSESMDPE